MKITQVNTLIPHPDAFPWFLIQLCFTRRVCAWHKRIWGRRSVQRHVVDSFTCDACSLCGCKGLSVVVSRSWKLWDSLPMISWQGAPWTTSSCLRKAWCLASWSSDGPSAVAHGISKTALQWRRPIHAVFKEALGLHFGLSCSQSLAASKGDDNRLFSSCEVLKSGLKLLEPTPAMLMSEIGL